MVLPTLPARVCVRCRGVLPDQRRGSQDRTEAGNGAWARHAPGPAGSAPLPRGDAERRPAWFARQSVRKGDLLSAAGGGSGAAIAQGAGQSCDRLSWQDQLFGLLTQPTAILLLEPVYRK